jgi:hypothetical protein
MADQTNQNPHPPGQGTSEGVYEQAREAVSDAADRASEMWDGAVDQGTKYYRDTTRAISNADVSMFAMLLLGAAAGYAIGWVAHGSRWSEQREVPDYARTRSRYGQVSRGRY